jgi:hypothetical protein
VLYEDGDEETLNLKKERWELIGDDVLPGVSVLPYLFGFYFTQVLEKRKRKKITHVLILLTGQRD